VKSQHQAAPRLTHAIFGRWTPRAVIDQPISCAPQSRVVGAVSSGMITVEEACCRYQMSEEEFLAWQRAFENGGIAGLNQKRRGELKSVPSQSLCFE